MSAMSEDLNDSAGSPLLSPSLSFSHDPEPSDHHPTEGRKRAAMDTADEEPAKRQATSGADVGQETVFRVLCPSSRVGGVIGKGGNVIEQIRKESGARIVVAESRGDPEYRVIIVSSPAAAGEEWSPAQDALLRIHSRIVEGEPRDELDVTATLFRMLVPGSQIGCLLGKGGTIVNQLRDESGAGIRIMRGDQVPRCALPTDEMVQVSGELSAARKALRAISERLRAYPPRDLPQRLPPRRPGPSLLPPPPPPAPSRPPLLASAPPALSLPRLENSMAALPMSLPLLSLAALGVPAGGDVLFRILFSAARIGALIGKGGTTIKQLRVDTRTRITVEPPVDGCEEQVVEIQGPEEEGASLCGAQEALFQVAALHAAAEPGAPTRLLVPSSQVGCLLGKGGTIIQDLRRQSTAQIRIMPRDTIPKCARVTDELVQVAGTPDSIHAALLLMTGRIRANPLRDLPRDRAPPPRTERDRDPGRERERERDGGRGPSERYVQAEQAEGARAAEYESLRRSHERDRGHDRDRDRDRDRERERERERGRERDWDRSRVPERRREEPRDRDRGRGRREDEHLGRARHEERRNTGHVEPPHHGSRGDRWAAGSGPGLLGGPTSSLHISVPTASVGSIIGKGGANITQIRQISGAKVKLHEARSRDPSVRMLEICGTIEQTQTAQGLLQTMLQDAALNGEPERPRR